MKKRNHSRVRSRLLDFGQLEDRRLLASLANGQEVTSSIGIGQQESFDFQVNTAGTVVVSVGETANFNANPFLELFGPSGSSLGTSTSETDAALRFVDLQPGTYTAVVSDQFSDEALDFRIRALTLPDAPELIARDNALANGQEFVSSVPVGGLAVYPIEVNTAGTLIVSVGETGNFNANPFLELFGPSGFSLGVSSSETDAVLRFVDVEPGTYTAVVSDQFGDEGLNFRIRALTLPDTPELIARDNALANGEEFVSSVPVGGLAVYPIEVNTAGTLIVSVGETANFNANPFLELFGPDGVSLGTSTSETDAALRFVDVEPGTYTAVVSDQFGDEALDFRIRALTLPDTPELIARDNALANGQEFVSSVPVGGLAVYPIEVNTAGTLIVSVGETGNFNANPFLELFGPGGVSLGTSSSETDAALRFVDLQPGTYTAVVSDQSGDEALSFRIRALTLPDAPELIARDNALANGEEFVSSVPVGGLAVYPIEVNTAGTVIVSVGETANFGANPFLELFGPDGVLLGTSTSETDAALRFVDVEPGTYTAVVSDEFGDEGLDFRIRALTLPDTPELIARDSALANGQGVVSSVPVGGLAVYPIELNAGGTVTVSVGETSNFGANPFLELFGPSGVSLGTSTSETAATLRFVDLQPGTYTAIVRDEFSDEAFGFSITAEFEDSSLLGDANLDGDVNFLDIAPFISLLSGNEFLDEADVNRDGSVDFLDISPFIGLLSSGGSAQAISNLNAPEIPSGSAVTPEVSSPVSLASIPESESIASVASTIENPLTAERPDAKSTAPATATVGQVSLDSASDSVGPPVAYANQPPALATTVTAATPLDTYTGPVAFTPDSYSFLDDRSSSLSDSERNTPLVNHRPLTGSTQSPGFSYESREQQPSATVPTEESFSTAAELFDAHPESLDEVFDYAF